MIANARDELRKKIAEKLAGIAAPEAVDAVLSLFSSVTARTEEHETTTWADPREQYAWSHLIVAEVVFDYGAYEGKPVELRGDRRS